MGLNSLRLFLKFETRKEFKIAERKTELHRALV
jgi:hypothetical protein